MTCLRNRWAQSSAQSGQTAVEFAIISSAFLLLVFAIAEMALVLFSYNSISDVTQEAARYAIAAGPDSPIPATTAQIQAFTVNSVPNLKLSASNVSVSWVADPNLSTRQDVKITVSYIYSLSIPFLHSVNLHLSSTSQMMASQ
jgi:Flp pilus assembly protein TadG